MSIDPEKVGDNMRRNVVSNYVALVFMAVRGLVVFRLLYGFLSSEEFGYWALLWSIFGYGVLLDFGFGVTVQKNVAQLTALKRWDELNEVLSTILVLYCGIGCVLVGIGFAATDIWSQWVEISPGNQERFGTIFTIFLTAMGLIFPLSVFQEVLRGQQRIALHNWLVVGSAAVGMGMMFVAVWLEWAFMAIVLIALAQTLVPPLLSIGFAFRYTPTLRISASLFSRSMVGEAMKFSFVAYFIMVSYMIMTKTDLIVIGTMLTVQAAAQYQVGWKLADSYSMLIRQVSRVMQPAAAHLYAKKDHSAISELLVGGIRFSGLLATPTYLITAFYMPLLIELLTGQSDPAPAATLVAHLLVLWSFSFVLTHNVYKTVAVMGGHERKLLWVGLLEAGANIGLSIALVSMGFGLVGVALGTLVPSVLLGWLVLWRWAAAEAEQGYLQFLRTTQARNVIVSLPLLGGLLATRALGALSPDAGWLPFAGCMAANGALALAAVTYWGLTPEERTAVAARLPGPLRRLAQGRG